MTFNSPTHALSWLKAQGLVESYNRTFVPETGAVRHLVDIVQLPERHPSDPFWGMYNGATDAFMVPHNRVRRRVTLGTIMGGTKTYWFVRDPTLIYGTRYDDIGAP